MNTFDQPHRLRFAALLFITLGGALVPDSASAQIFVPSDPEMRGPKTLLHWSGIPENEGPEGPAPRLITDRPHVAEATALVGLGRVQIENGYTYYLENSKGTRTQTHSYPETLFRAGVFREWFEFRLAYNYFNENTDSAGSRQVSLAGSDDIYVGAKVALTKQAGVLPEFTVFPQMRVPTGHKNFSSGQVLPGVNFAYSWMLTEKFELEANTQVNRRLDDSPSHYYTEILQTFNFEYDLCDELMVFNEFILQCPNGALVIGPQYYEHTGIHIFLTQNLQIDVHAAVGLNEYADNFFGGTGLSWRW